MLSESFRKDWVKNGNPVFVSFSGGSDSLAMLLLLNHFAKQKDLPLSAVHFEHGLRGNDSIKDAEFCRAAAERLQIPFLCRSLDVPRNRRRGESDETAARRLRLEAWTQWQEQGILPANAWIALAHHADDARETLLLRLIRGSNVSGLTALREKRVLAGLCFVRPLLGCSKNDLIQYLRDQGIFSWCYDATNEESCYARNYFRLQIIQDIQKRFSFAQQGLTRSLEALNMDADFLEQSAEKEYYTLLDHRKLSLSGFRKLHPALQHRVIRKFLSERLHQDYLPDGDLLRRIRSTLEVLSAAPTQKVKLPLAGVNHVFLLFFRDHIDLENNLPQDPDERRIAADFYPWHWQKEPVFQTPWGIFSAELLSADQNVFSVDQARCIFLDADEISDSFLIASKKPGDTMIPFGKTHAKKCKKIFSDAHISADQQTAIPFLRTDSGNVIWMTGVRRSSFAVTTEKTQKILKINFSAADESAFSVIDKK